MLNSKAISEQQGDYRQNCLSIDYLYSDSTDELWNLEEGILAMSDTLIFEHDIAIPMRDREVLYANVYRPMDSGEYPVIMTFGPYGKDVHFGDFNAPAYAQIA